MATSSQGILVPSNPRAAPISGLVAPADTPNAFDDAGARERLELPNVVASFLHHGLPDPLAVHRIAGAPGTLEIDDDGYKQGIVGLRRVRAAANYAICNSREPDRHPAIDTQAAGASHAGTGSGAGGRRPASLVTVNLEPKPLPPRAQPGLGNTGKALAYADADDGWGSDYDDEEDEDDEDGFVTSYSGFVPATGRTTASGGTGSGSSAAAASSAGATSSAPAAAAGGASAAGVAGSRDGDGSGSGDEGMGMGMGLGASASRQ